MDANNIQEQWQQQMNISVCFAAETVQDFMRANETLSTFLLTNSTMSPVTVDQLMKARLNLQVRRWLYCIVSSAFKDPRTFQLSVCFVFNKMCGTYYDMKKGANNSHKQNWKYFHFVHSFT